MIAKKESVRLPGKNTKDFNGMPMFLWNLMKLCELFENVVFDSDCPDMCSIAKSVGAKISLRNLDLRGNDTPSVPIFISIINKFPNFNKIINLQANSPNTSLEVINNCAIELKSDSVNEVLTCYSNGEINGSVWGFSRSRLECYGDFYLHSPDALVIDDAIDIHTMDEYRQALSILGK